MMHTRQLFQCFIVMVFGWATFAHAEPKLLEPEQAFQVKVRQRHNDNVTAHFTIADNYYLYRDRMRIAVKDTPGVVIQSVHFPAGIMKQDPNFGRMEIYKNAVAVNIVLKRPAGTQKVTLVIDYQGCEEKTGVCYPPMQKALMLTLKD
ncbi:protein-disulfide reductase DsbD N-terminal domain-containing protein [Oxalobacteraceae bacterium R-40]|uniref:Protein-disulfide reductase DsbD N-terminal domain-containing protein n=1 Tax=Keguizhuia sedimenti TaxID=3064264 RepID=A0ABU1BW30_9BURK|nr:protein-disulfide reductase DsbD N-terminal domain-containing protein [Oxalobacteraceae bacterium R-40]